jgi:hypothetical protein
LNNVLNRSVHEVRGINADMKAAATVILQSLEFQPTTEPVFPLNEIRNKANNIKALAEILSARTDFLDFFANRQSANFARTRIRAYQKFDKTIRSLRARALEKRVRLELKGNSIGEIQGFAYLKSFPI